MMFLKTHINMPSFIYKNRSGYYWLKCLCPFWSNSKPSLLQNNRGKKAQSIRDCPGSHGRFPLKMLSWKLLWLGRTALSGALCITRSSPTRKFTLYCIPFDKNSNGGPFASLWDITSSVQLICFDYLPSVITAYCHPSPHLATKKKKIYRHAIQCQYLLYHANGELRNVCRWCKEWHFCFSAQTAVQLLH